MRWLLVLVLACGKAADPPKPKVVDARIVDAMAIDAPTIDAPESPWGAPVKDPAAEKLAMEAFASIAGGKAKPELFGDIVIVGPALWKTLAGADKKLAKVGTHSEAVIPGAKLQKLEMRTFIQPKDKQSLLASTAVRGLAQHMMDAGPRPANAAERQLFYALVPFELVGKPVTILEHPDISLIVYAEDGKILWLDASSLYGQ